MLNGHHRAMFYVFVALRQDAQQEAGKGLSSQSFNTDADNRRGRCARHSKERVKVSIQSNDHTAIDSSTFQDCYVFGGSIADISDVNGVNSSVT